MNDTNEGSTSINKQSALQAAADALAKRQAMLASITNTTTASSSSTTTTTGSTVSFNLSTPETNKQVLWQREEAWKNPLLAYQTNVVVSSESFDKSLLPSSVTPSFIYYFDPTTVEYLRNPPPPPDGKRRLKLSSSEPMMVPMVKKDDGQNTYYNDYLRSSLHLVPLHYPLIFTEGHDQIGYRVWDGGIMLSKYVEYQFAQSLYQSMNTSPPTTFSSSVLLSKEEWQQSLLPLSLFQRVIEIGSGTGIVSMVVACLQSILQTYFRSARTPSSNPSSVPHLPNHSYTIGTDIVPVIRKMIEQGTLNGFSIPVIDLPEVKNELIVLKDDDDDDESSKKKNISMEANNMNNIQQYYIRENLSTVYSCLPLPWGDTEWMTKLQTFIRHMDHNYTNVTSSLTTSKATTTSPSLIIASDLAAHPSTVKACMDTISTLLPTPIIISSSMISNNNEVSFVIPEFILCCQMHREFTEPFLTSLEKSYDMFQVPAIQLNPSYNNSNKHTIWRIRPKIILTK